MEAFMFGIAFGCVGGYVWIKFDRLLGIVVWVVGVVCSALVGMSVQAQVTVKAGDHEPGKSMSLLFNDEFHSCRPVFGEGLMSIFEVQEKDSSIVTMQVLSWSDPDCKGEILAVSEPWVRSEQTGGKWGLYVPEPTGGEFWALAALAGVAARRRR